MFCQVYRSPRKEEMYLYVEKSAGLDCVPQALLQRFGEPEPVMLLHLNGERRLARVDADEVLAQVRDQGYFLQMPPGPKDLKRQPNE